MEGDRSRASGVTVLALVVGVGCGGGTTGVPSPLPQARLVPSAAAPPVGSQPSSEPGGDTEVTDHPAPAGADARVAEIAALEAALPPAGAPDPDPTHTVHGLIEIGDLYLEVGTRPAARHQEALVRALGCYHRALREHGDLADRPHTLLALATALRALGRGPEARGALLAVACRSVYRAPTADPTNPERDSVTALPQDHDAAFWASWQARYPTSQALASARASSSSRAEELRYVDPFPRTCMPMVGGDGLPLGQHEVVGLWLSLGDLYSEGLDPLAGPYALNRAASAYARAEAATTPPDVGLGLKLGRTFLAQGRHEAAAKKFVAVSQVLERFRRVASETGESIESNLEHQAAANLVRALVAGDWRGQGPDMPTIAQPSKADTGPELVVPEDRLRTALARLQTLSGLEAAPRLPSLVLSELINPCLKSNELPCQALILEVWLRRWPQHMRGLEHALLRAYDGLAEKSPAGTKERAEYERKAAALRAKGERKAR